MPVGSLDTGVMEKNEMKINDDDLTQDAMEALDEEFGEIETVQVEVSDPAYDSLVEALSALASALSAQLQNSHVIDDKLTNLMPSIYDTIH